MKKGQWILIAGVIIAGAAGIYFLTRKKKGEPEFTFDSQGNVVLPEGDKKFQEQLDYLHAKIPGSNRKKDSLIVPYFLNFYVQFFDNGRFVLGASPDTVFNIKGYWKEFGNTILFDDGRAFSSKTIGENLNILKKATVSNRKMMKLTSEYRQYEKEIGSGVPSAFKAVMLEKKLNDIISKYQ
jgi:LPXTG-motif cell wall-anchored protein